MVSQKKLLFFFSFALKLAKYLHKIVLPTPGGPTRAGNNPVASASLSNSSALPYCPDKTISIGSNHFIFSD